METLQIIHNANLVPEATKSYTPVANTDFINRITEEAEKHGFKLLSQHWNTANKGLMMNGKMIFDGNDPEMGMQVALINSYDKSRPATLALGSEVFVCTNGCISADYALRRRHTTNVWTDLDALIVEAMGNLTKEFEGTQDFRKHLREISFNKTQQAELLGRIFVEEDILKPTVANVVRREIIKPTYGAFADQNLWSFYNHCTHALKKAHPIDQDRRLIALTNLFKHEFLN